MAKLNYGVHINATEKTITLATFEGGFIGMKRELGIDIAEAVNLGGGVTMWIDEEGRLKSGQDWFKFDGNLFAGSAMIQFGEWVTPRLEDQIKLKGLIEFVDGEVLTEEETEPVIEFLTKEKVQQYIKEGKMPAHMLDFYA